MIRHDPTLVLLSIGKRRGSWHGTNAAVSARGNELSMVPPYGGAVDGELVLGAGLWMYPYLCCQLFVI